VASPAALIVAVAGVELVQLAVEVITAVEPSLYVAVAVNCCVATAEMLAVLGVTAIEVSVFAIAPTASVAAPLTPLSDAVIVVEPVDNPVTNPSEFTVATVAVELVQVAVVVTSAVEPSLYVPIAANCVVAPTAMLAVLGDAEIDVSVFGERVVE
jgi:hypothetical protein